MRRYYESSEASGYPCEWPCFLRQLLRVVQLAGVADTWKPTRREIGSVQAGSMAEVLEDLIVVEAPDIVWVSRPIEEMKLREGDTILRYPRLGEGWADLWANGCWYKQANAGFMVEPDGAGCGGDRCSAQVTKMGGQKQRTAIARALIRNPQILILDDALSSVDTQTEDRILNYLREIMRGRTTIFISHRVSTVRNADRIAVLHDGEIVEYGTHDELIERNGYYTELYHKQLLEEELEVV